MKTLGLSLITLGLVLGALPAVAQETGETTFTLEAHTDGSQNYFAFPDGTKNPTLVVPAGETITVTLVNVGTGSHNIHVEGQDPSEYVVEDGEQITYTFTAPESGSVDYWCDPHKSQGMAGTVRVAGSEPANGGGSDGGEGGNDTPGIQVGGLAVALLGAALIFGRRS